MAFWPFHDVEFSLVTSYFISVNEWSRASTFAGKSMCFKMYLKIYRPRKTLGHNPSMGVAYSSLWAPDWNDFILLPTKQTDFHEKGFALDLPLKARVSEIWKWLTLSSVTYTMTNCQKIQPTVDIRYTNFKNGTKAKLIILWLVVQSCTYQIGTKIRPSVKWTVTGDLKWLDWDL